MAILKRLVLCILLFAAASAHAGASARLDSLRIKAFRQCDIPDAGTQKITAPVGNDAVNLAITWVCAFGPAIERFDTVWITSSIVGASLNADFDRVSIAELIWTDTTSDGVLGTIRVPLHWLPEDSIGIYLSSKGDIQPVDSKNPMTWKWFRTFGQRFLLYPHWSRTDSVQVLVQYYAQDSVLQSNASQTGVRQKFLDAVIEYAAFKLARKRENLDNAVQSLNVARMYYGLPPVKKEEILER